MRYNLLKKIKDESTNEVRYETVHYPKFERRNTDKFIISHRGDRMDLIAHRYYDNAQLWWIIQLANNLPGGTLMIPPGTQIRIPYPLDSFDFNDKFLEAQQ